MKKTSEIQPTNEQLATMRNLRDTGRLGCGPELFESMYMALMHGGWICCVSKSARAGLRLTRKGERVLEQSERK